MLWFETIKMVPTIFGNGGMRRIGLPVPSSVSYFWVVCDHCCVWSPITSPLCFLSFAQNHVQKLSPQQGQGPGHPVWVVWVIPLSYRQSQRRAT